MRYLKRNVIYIMLLVMGVICFGASVSAERLNFTVTPIYSAHQRQDIKGYFDLRVKPGETEIIQVELENHSDKAMDILINANTVVTNDSVTADYSQQDVEKNHTLNYPFSEIATVDPEVNLKPREKKIVDVTVKIPEKPFDGIILGGLAFEQKDQAGNEDKAGNLVVKNNFAFVLAVRLSENDEKVPVKVDLLEVKAGQRNYRNTVLVTFENPEPRILPDVEIESFLYSEKDVENALFYNKIEHADIAPNSSFDYGISLNNQAYKPGKYVLKSTVRTLGERFEFEKKFTISNYEAKKLNDEAVDLIKPEFDWAKFTLVLFFTLLLVIIVLVVLVIKYKKKPVKKKQSQQDKRKNRQNKKKR